MVRTRKRRRRSRRLPPDLCELTISLIKHSESFLKTFESSEGRMSSTVRTLEETAERAERLQRTSEMLRTAGGVTAVGLFVVLTATGAGGLLTAAAAAAAVVGSAVVGAKLLKTSMENRRAKNIENQGNVFMEMVDPLKEKLEVVQAICGKLEEKSSEDVATQTLRKVEEFQKTLEEVSDLRGKSDRGLTAGLRQMIGELLRLLLSIFRITATLEDDKGLTEAIVQSAALSRRVVSAFLDMNQKLISLLER